MKITIEPTSKIVELNGVPARVWEGHTESGISVHAFITRVAAPLNVNCAELENALRETSAPSPEVAAYPARLIL